MAASLVRAVLGAGMLVTPPLVMAVAGSADLLVWAAHLALGATVALLLGSLMVRTRWQPMPVSAVAGAALGSWARTTVDGCYTVAFAAGQAAIAWFVATAVRAAAAADGGSHAGAGPWLALAVVAAAVLVAASPLRIPRTVLQARPWLVGALAVACGACRWPLDVPSAVAALVPARTTGAAALWLALAALFFAGVGWEAVTEVREEQRGEPSLRRTMTGVGLGATAVAATYLGLAGLWRWAPAAGAAASSATLRHWLGAATAVVLASYVVTNLRAAAGTAARLRVGRGVGRVPRRGLVVAIGVVSCAFVVAGARDGGVTLLLLGPAAGATVAYALGCAAVVLRGGPVARWVAGLVTALLVVLASLAVPASRAV